MPGILVVDDHPAFRLGVMQVLARELNDAVFGEAGTADEALAKIREQPWDLVLLDISLPDKNGIEVLIETKTARAKPRFLVLSMHPEAQYAKGVLRIGAEGYLTKSSAATELVRAVHTILGGGKYVSPRLAQQLASDLVSRPDKLPHEILSKREFQVMCRLAAGVSTSQIAKDLGISVKTVSTFRTRVLKKLTLKSNSDITRYAILHSLIE